MGTYDMCGDDHCLSKPRQGTAEHVGPIYEKSQDKCVDGHVDADRSSQNLINHSVRTLPTCSWEAVPMIVDQENFGSLALKTRSILISSPMQTTLISFALSGLYVSFLMGEAGVDSDLNPYQYRARIALQLKGIIGKFPFDGLYVPGSEPTSPEASPPPREPPAVARSNRRSRKRKADHLQTPSETTSPVPIEAVSNMTKDAEAATPEDKYIASLEVSTSRKKSVSQLIVLEHIVENVHSGKTRSYARGTRSSNWRSQR